jgi:group I intron endonuclease
MKPFYAYKLTNTVTGKSYIGITKKTVAARWTLHVGAALRGKSSHISEAIRKYGKDAFIVECILCCLDYNDLMEYERILIDAHGTLKPGGYNLTRGGGGMVGFKFSDESRKKMSESRMGIVLSDETRAKMSAHWKGKVFSDETKARISASKKGIPRDPETMAKVSETMKRKNAERKEAGLPSLAAIAASKRTDEQIRLTVERTKATKAARIAAGVIYKKPGSSARVKSKEEKEKQALSLKKSWAPRKLRIEVETLAAAGCHA